MENDFGKGGQNSLELYSKSRVHIQTNHNNFLGVYSLITIILHEGVELNSFGFSEKESEFITKLRYTTSKNNSSHEAIKINVVWKIEVLRLEVNARLVYKNARKLNRDSATARRAPQRPYPRAAAPLRRFWARPKNFSLSKLCLIVADMLRYNFIHAPINYIEAEKEDKDRNGETCEFCMLLKPVVYCEADAAHLCLPCDAKVHSANALSNRHPRTLVCEPCGYNLAYIRCSDHQMFMCRDCDRRHHDLSSQHQRQVITSYMGSPSANDLAALWGFGLKDLENTNPPDQ
ncbi:hypothetical protein RND71_008705 [Anisodus tanguticus]|uniref:B box-type domain-containing protein n=1 Tax=Anisodus tanguticus TaxID=243964 RepID=A0AAE1SPB9_9SOLA|nr:hypothetical protein RND71_008705 [Anisodus tanguticus]